VAKRLLIAVDFRKLKTCEQWSGGVLRKTFGGSGRVRLSDLGLMGWVGSRNLDPCLSLVIAVIPHGCRVSKK